MHNIKLCARNEEEQETLIETIRISCQDIKMEFGIEKCAMIIIEIMKREAVEGIGWQNQESIRTLGKKGKLQELGNIGSGHHWTSGEEGKIKEYQRTKKLLETNNWCYSYYSIIDKGHIYSGL